jgi:phytoene dehydrogenase-like protein
MIDGVPDAVVIGAGQNGLVAANLLADAGWSVEVLEQQPTPGGAVRSDSEVADGFVHDTFSAFYPFAAASPVMRSLDLEQHGLTWVHAPAVLGNPLPGSTATGEWALQVRDPEQTATWFDRAHRGDGAAWLHLTELWDRVGDDFLSAMLSPFPPVRRGLAMLSRLVHRHGPDTVELMLSSITRIDQRRFGGAGPALLMAGDSQHGDLPPGRTGSGLAGWMFTMMGHEFGFPVPRGGAGQIPAALIRRLESLGGSVRCGVEVTDIDVRGGRAVGVRTADRDRVPADRAVLADVSAPRLYGGLVSWDDLPARTRLLMRRFRWDPATVKVDWALDATVPWDPAPEAMPGCVHIAESITELAATDAEIRRGLVPRHPFLVLGQMTTTDPSRSPAGTESMWGYAHVPQILSGDAGDGTIGNLDPGDGAERFADRMQARIERFAPGFGDRVLARRVLSPADLELRNANLHGGAVNGGSAAQVAVLRPVLGLGRAETPVRGLFLSGASAHPGGGVHGAPGANAARAALAAVRRGRNPVGGVSG